MREAGSGYVGLEGVRICCLVSVSVALDMRAYASVRFDVFVRSHALYGHTLLVVDCWINSPHVLPLRWTFTDAPHALVLRERERVVLRSNAQRSTPVSCIQAVTRSVLTPGVQ